MRYWSYFAAKLALAAAILYALLRWIVRFWPAEAHPPPIAPLRDASGILVYNIVLMGWVLLCAAALALIVIDQFRRCRVCLRRLRMPLETGSWSGVLLTGRPRTEYICPYGHGTLRQEELGISGLRLPEWTPHTGGLLEELGAAPEEPKTKP
ncbi:MAG TPA: hypothetical protein VMU19_06870 [Bryobacteraceae bacterium]|nr:hypothetical protein [Bryobacteraceae bacterium]